ncbi:MAG: hypothetical protein QOF61_1980 [Acidobacteriota bacterium]|jgi:uncharacterized membrane protein|nr:hypothetical protein [Acidobacteriota bacterium]
MRPDRPRKTPPSIITGERVTGSLPARPPSLASQEIADDERATETASITLAGRKMTSTEFTTAMVHFHRAEIQRSNTWRNRLDTTTNWAVITAGATLSFAFSDPKNPHFVILINTILVAFFLTMEARRYRYYEIWASRVRVIETGFFAQMLKPTPMTEEWAEHLALDLRTPHFTISIWEALGRRLRRNYLWLFLLLAASWNLKVYLHPFPATDLDVFIMRAAVGIVPGDVVFLFGFIFNVGVVIFAFATVRLKQATGEVLPTHEFHPFRSVSNTVSRVALTPRRVTARRTKRARERTRTLRTGTQTGEWKRVDTADLPERNTEPVREETLT